MRNLCLAILLLVSLTAYAILPDTVYIHYPEQYGLVYRDLAVRTTDGYNIATWFFPAQQAKTDADFAQWDGKRWSYATLDDTPRPTIVICNGDAGNMSYFQLPLARAYTALGFNVVTFDWRGFGHSSTFSMDSNYLCYTEMLTDYNAVLSTVAEQPEVASEAIILMGWSTGAYLSMITAYTNDKVAAFVGRSLCTDFEDFIPLVMEKRNKTTDEVLVPKDFPKEYMPIHIAKEFRKPIFLIVGGHDFRTPVWMSQKVLDALPVEIPQELMIVQDAGHGGKEDPMILDFENFIARSAEFLQKNVKPNKQ